MTIHDELVLKLIDPDKWGKATGYVTEIVGSKDIRYTLEEMYWYQGHYEKIMNEFVRMSPDVVVNSTKPSKTTAIEMENDVNWDFGESLRQIRKYKRNRDFQDVVVIIPKRYERFAILYATQGVRVYFWKATRLWECGRCGEITESDKTAKPKCSSSKCNSGELEFVGIKDAEFTPFEYALDKIC